MRYSQYIIILLLLISCYQKKEKVEGNWIIGTENERIKTSEKQYNGFDTSWLRREIFTTNCIRWSR